MSRKLIQDRWYLVECVDALFEAVQESNCHPLAAIPTGAGKTPILCKLVDKILSANPRENILILSHTQEILEQDHEALRDYLEWDDDADDYIEPSQIGLYSSGLDSRTIKKITVAGIQSVFRRADEFKRFTKIIIDECHLINTKEAGMYRKFLSKLEANYIGLTATPYRTGHGRLHEGNDALFTELVYDLTSFENFNRLVDEGYLSKLYSKKTKLRLDTDSIKLKGNDFDQQQLSTEFDRDEITRAAVKETIEFGKKYKKWLFFAIDIKHAENIAAILNENGIRAVAVHSKMNGRKTAIKDFKDGVYRAIVNVDILTTGFDDPEIDLIVHLRPTHSIIFWVQSTGRGLRVVYAVGYLIETIKERLKAIKKSCKKHCLVLDFAGNGLRLGPINDVNVESPRERKKKGQAMVKFCPECDMQNHLSAKQCSFCGHEFPRKEKLQAEADGNTDIVTKQRDEKVTKKLRVKSIKYSIVRNRKTMKDVFKATYVCGIGKAGTVHAWVALDDNGQARHFAQRWVDLHWKKKFGEKPYTVEELKYAMSLLKKPKKLKVVYGGKQPEITNYYF